jgi:hypothetical protein
MNLGYSSPGTTLNQTQQGIDAYADIVGSRGREQKIDERWMLRTGRGALGGHLGPGSQRSRYRRRRRSSVDEA